MFQSHIVANKLTGNKNRNNRDTNKMNPQKL